MVNDEEHGTKTLEQILELRKMLAENMFNKHHKMLIETYDYILEKNKCIWYKSSTDPITYKMKNPVYCGKCQGYNRECNNYSKEK